MTLIKSVIATWLSLAAVAVQAAEPPAAPPVSGQTQEIALEGRLRATRAAAERGNPEAQIQLGEIYGSGYGVPQDYTMAYVWFDLAAAQGNETAQFNRDAVAALMDSPQRQQAQTLAKQYYEKYVAPFKKEERKEAKAQGDAKEEAKDARKK